MVGVAIGSRKHPYVNILFGARAQAPQLALLQNAQQFGLRGIRHLADLVQQKTASGSEFEAACAPIHRAGERAFLVPEDLALDQRFRNGCAVYADERLCLARAQLVQGAGYKFLSCSALAGDQYVDVRGRDLLDQSEDLAHGPRVANQRTKHSAFTQPAPRHFEFDLCFALPRGVGKDGAETGGVDRLL